MASPANSSLRSITAELAVVGPGYVGLPLSLQFARSGVSVVGLDIETRKVEALNEGRSYIQHIPAENIAGMTKAKKFAASTDFSMVRHVDAVIICVPTPLNKNREPDISYIIETGKAIAPHLAPGPVQNAECRMGEGRLGKRKAECTLLR